MAMLPFLLSSMTPVTRLVGRGALPPARLLLQGRAVAAPARHTGPWLCMASSSSAAPVTPTAPMVPLPDGVLVVHKPQNWTSFDVVAKVRNTLQDHFRGHGHKFSGRKKLKVGHGGTLDPMATGLLVIGVGKGCRALEGYLRGAKSYAAVAQLGSETDSQARPGPPAPSLDLACACVARLLPHPACIPPASRCIWACRTQRARCSRARPLST